MSLSKNEKKMTRHTDATLEVLLTEPQRNRTRTGKKSEVEQILFLIENIAARLNKPRG